MRFIVFGDVVGRAGREALSRALPGLKKEYKADSVIVNIENVAHGSGISTETEKETKTWKADVYTTGDHAWDNPQGVEALEQPDGRIIRPANYPAGVPGRGWLVYNVGAYTVAVINLQGQVFFRNHPNNPFLELDRLLNEPMIRQAQIKLVDFHTEATSEIRAFGWYADGRISAVWGTHTHVPTADSQIMPEGTGYISDLGMVGRYESIIGADRESPLKGFLTQMKMKITYDDTSGPGEIGGVFLDIDPKTGKTTTIEHIRRLV